jgi:hypothetical protein
LAPEQATTKEVIRRGEDLRGDLIESRAQIQISTETPQQRQNKKRNTENGTVVVTENNGNS